MAIAARIVVVGILGLGTGLGGGMYAGLNDDAWRTGAPAAQPIDTATLAPSVEAERAAREAAERRAAAAEDRAAIAAARLVDVSDELAALRASADEGTTQALAPATLDASAPTPGLDDGTAAELARLADQRSLELERAQLALADAERALADARDEAELARDGAKLAREGAERARTEAGAATEDARASAERAAELERLADERAAALDAARGELESASAAAEAALAAADEFRAEAARARADADASERRADDLQALAAERAAALAAADAARRDLLRLAAAERVDALLAEIDELWPARPERLDAMRAWLAAADAELALLDDHRAARDRLAARVAAESADDGERWWADALAALVDDLEHLADPERGPVHGVAPEHGWGVARRATFAETVESLSVTGADARERWAEAARYAADGPVYDALELRPEAGLLPLGVDPGSGLLEFAWLASGAAPERGPDGRLALDEGSAAVLVLVPGGRDWLGAQSSDRGAPNWDPLALDGEGPPRQVRLEPYLLGKHELTQGQWLRLVGSNPSRYGPGTWGDRPVDLAHPVTDVPWVDAVAMLARYGLRLPTEAEWEFAARAGADSPWWTGTDARSLGGAVNVADSYAGEHGGASWPGRLEWLDDGHTVMARIDSFRANGFGLHHVHGNVWEWCLDGFADLPRATGGPLDAPLVDPSESLRRVVRGGAYNSNVLEARAAYRRSYTPATAGAALGLRIARDLGAE